MPNSSDRHIARDTEIDKPRFDQRIDDDHFAAASPDLHQGPHQSRMIARRVAADDEDQIRGIHVFEHNGRRAAAGAAGQSNAARLMTVVTTIVDVIRAIQPREELQQKARLVAAASREVPKSLIGRSLVVACWRFVEMRPPRGSVDSGAARGYRASAASVCHSFPTREE